MDAEGGKLASGVVVNKEVLAAMAQDPPSQMAQLIALEYYLGMNSPDKLNQVCVSPSHSLPPNAQRVASATVNKGCPVMQVMHVLKALYDEDIVEEDIILAWHARPSTGKALGVTPVAAEKVRKAAAPFVGWLEEASDEESDDEE